MRVRLVLILVVAAWIVAASIFLIRPEGDLIPSDRYYFGQVASFEANPVSGRVLMLGDSITARGKWEERLPGCGIVNRAIEFETTAGALARLDEVERVGAKVSMVMLGTNDISNSLPVADIFQRYRQIIVRLGKGSEVIVVSTTLQDASQAENNRQITTLNEALKAECRRGFCRYLDLNDEIALKGAALPSFLIDGVHLSPAGYKRWTEMIRVPLGCAA